MKAALNKHRLNQLQQDLTLYERFLPALDLKRQQLMAKQKALKTHIKEQTDLLSNSVEQLSNQFPWLEKQKVDLNQVTSIKRAPIQEKKEMGVFLLSLSPDEKVEFSSFTHTQKPYWYALLYQSLKPILERHLTIQLLNANLIRLDNAAKKATQKVNLFSKVKIPDTKIEMRKINLFLGDQEKAAVIRAKLAKNKRQEVS